MKISLIAMLLLSVVITGCGTLDPQNPASVEEFSAKAESLGRSAVIVTTGGMTIEQKTQLVVVLSQVKDGVSGNLLDVPAVKQLITNVVSKVTTDPLRRDQYIRASLAVVGAVEGYLQPTSSTSENVQIAWARATQRILIAALTGAINELNRV